MLKFLGGVVLGMLMMALAWHNASKPKPGMESLRAAHQGFLNIQIGVDTDHRHVASQQTQGHVGEHWPSDEAVDIEAVVLERMKDSTWKEEVVTTYVRPEDALIMRRLILETVENFSNHVKIERD